MKTPIFDFVTGYIKSKNERFHMPGHKGVSYLGCEEHDITEIDGADSLYDAAGIIKESEANASRLFGSRTFYSTEGSSHAIRAMMSIACLMAKEGEKKALVWAGRNAHSAFLSAAALLDFSIEWLYPSLNGSGYLSCVISPAELDKRLSSASVKPMAVYLTSPDYLGNMSDIAAISRICKKHGVLLLIDNAHGAYLKFLPRSEHPIDLGADMCADSAHKTLPVLTGGAYLHISSKLSSVSDEQVRESLRLFGSTSPSYLILQSLDLANRYLYSELPERIDGFLRDITKMKERLFENGYTLISDEPYKLTIDAKAYGYYGREIADVLAENGVVAEFSDRDFAVLMMTPSHDAQSIERVTSELLRIPRKLVIAEPVPSLRTPEAKMSVRCASMLPFEVLPIDECCGRVMARASVTCPPAVAVLVCGELIDKSAIDVFRYYGIEKCKVVKKF